MNPRVIYLLRDNTQVRGVMVLKTAPARIYTCALTDARPSMCIKKR